MLLNYENFRSIQTYLENTAMIIDSSERFVVIPATFTSLGAVSGTKTLFIACLSFMG
jgi:hypothetical protein